MLQRSAAQSLLASQAISHSLLAEPLDRHLAPAGLDPPALISDDAWSDDGPSGTSRGVSSDGAEGAEFMTPNGAASMTPGKRSSVDPQA
jgi:hypothetical protein